MNELSRARRLVLGICVLLLVDVIWVASAELTEVLFEEPYGHGRWPYFCTYLKTSMLISYMTGFLIWRSWRMQCSSAKYRQLKQKDDESTYESPIEADKMLSDPIFVPVKFGRSSSSSSTDSDESGGKSVRFNRLSEVRHLTEKHAEEAILSRLSHAAYMRAEEARLKVASKLSVKQIAKLAAIFCVVFFFAHLFYQEAQHEAKRGMANVLSSTAGLFTLVLAALFPSCTGDRFTLSKFVAVIISIGGVVMLSLHEMQGEFPVHALWAVMGALLYAVYLVMVRRRVDNEEKLNMPMFFGFVGFFTIVLLWPGLLIVHLSSQDEFPWPSGTQWSFLVVNGLIGTVISELLWLWGCFLTSSLVATLSLTLTHPMTILANAALKLKSYSWLSYVGTGPVFIAFFAVTILSFYENWDPVWLLVKKIIQCFCRKRSILRVRDMDREQTETLISINTERVET